MGSHAHKGKWRDFSEWPPVEVEEEVLVLGAGSLRPADEGAEVNQIPAGIELRSHQRSIVFDPLKPTPALG
eukprot:3871293-Amphidinium_carterae.1